MLPQLNLKESMVTYVNKLEQLINEVNEFPEPLNSEIKKLNIDGVIVNGTPTKKLS